LPRQAFTVTRIGAVELAFHWRWLVALALGTLVLGGYVLPARLPSWDDRAIWLTSFLVMLASEATLLLHEVGHIIAARITGERVVRVVFHGFGAETILANDTPDRAAAIALVGPGTSALLAIVIAGVRVWLEPGSPPDLVAVLLMLGNAGLAIMSLLPVGQSDGGRALRAFVSARSVSS
jgi:hypothetical protein